MSKKIINVKADNFQQEVLASKTPVLVDFWAAWCGPCVAIGQVIDELDEEISGQIKIAKIDIEESTNQELAMKYQVQSIPNLKLFNNGQIVKEFIGLQNKDFLKKELLSAIK